VAGEYGAVVGGDYALKVGDLLDERYGFHVFQISGQAPDAATVPFGPGNDDKVRFDIVLDQRIIDPTHIPQRYKKIYYYCECKWRTNNRDLKNQLKDFLKKALKAMPHLERQHVNDYGFIFISNKPFGIDQVELQKIEIITELLNDPGLQAGEIARLCSKVSILFFSDWFLETTAKGVTLERR
jgi:hypothetical protein